MHTQDFSRAAIGLVEPFQNFHGGFARAIGPEQAEAFAYTNGEIEPVERDESVIFFDQRRATQRQSLSLVALREI